MSIVFHQVKEGEFRRLAETKTMTKILAQESTEFPNTFMMRNSISHFINCFCFKSKLKCDKNNPKILTITFHINFIF